LLRLIGASENEIENIYVGVDKDISSAIEALEKSSLKSVVVTDLDGMVHGVISDGDIRRALYRGLSSVSLLAEIMCSEPVVVVGDVRTDEVLQIMEDKKINFIPLVDDKGVLKGVWSAYALAKLSPLENRFVIMAGGKGSRLGELTLETPKPLLEVGGTPIIEKIIRSARQSGFRNFIITVNYLSDKIVEYLEDGGWLDVNIEYVHEDQPLGTAGSLSLINPHLTSPCILVNGDIVSDVCYRELLQYHLDFPSGATVAVRTHVMENPYGVLHIVDNELLSFEEKPKYISDINAGMYVLNPEVLEQMQVGVYIDMPTLLMDLVDNGGRVSAYRLKATWVDVGRPDDLFAARKVESKND